ncbi:hypothetical protein [Brevundimonas sp. SL161]|uniref:hypothetical protein n=1 Tax=Brevundimonas sp. SL161 TaxID=2804613 RepID=UPI003CF097BB
MTEPPTLIVHQPPAPIEDEEQLESQRRALTLKLDGRQSGKYSRVLLAALSGIPWVGSFLGAAGTYSAEIENEQLGELQRLWLKEHEAKLKRLGITLASVLGRLDSFGEDLQERIQSEEYLSLVRQGFRSWDQAETEEKREFIRKLLENAGGTKLCPDDLVRLFIAWIDTYHESHFAVIRVLHQNAGATRADIWREVGGSRVREDSAEADLFKLLVRDLSTGSVIRQHRDTTPYGDYVKKARASAGNRTSNTVKSAFDSQESYELTELGKQFVHYTMNELVSQVGQSTSSP